MRRFVSSFFLLVLVGACGPSPFDSPLPPGVRVYAPLAYNAYVAGGGSVKRGVALQHAPCEALGLLGVSWYYNGPECPGYERVVYLDGWGSLVRGRVVGMPFMMINEPDGPNWDWPVVDRIVERVAEMLEPWPGGSYPVGPCVAWDVGYIERFWVKYRAYVGREDARPQAVCVHCYEGADACIDRIGSAMGVGDRLGVYDVWVTEFGMVPGLEWSMETVLAENDKLVAYMEAEPRVARYAYWSGMYVPGDGAPADPLTGWQPLTYWYERWGGDRVLKRTVLGEWYAGY